MREDNRAENVRLNSSAARDMTSPIAKHTSGLWPSDPIDASKWINPFKGGLPKQKNASADPMRQQQAPRVPELADRICHL